MAFSGMRVISFESRRAAEMAELIRRQGGEPFVAPSMREIPLEANEEAFAFAGRLFQGEFDMMIFLTGVGARALHKVLASRFPPERLAETLRSLAVAVRGPKPMAVMREWGVPVAVTALEPNTWRELLDALKGRPERRIAVQEYGRSNEEFLEALRQSGAQVTPVRVYQWDLPEDREPLREAARRIAAGDADVAMFTTTIQIAHLLQTAAESGSAEAVRDNLNRSMVVASIGPTTSEALEDHGVRPDMTPSHPKMGFLVKEAAEQAGEVLARKRREKI